MSGRTIVVLFETDGEKSGAPEERSRARAARKARAAALRSALKGKRMVRRNERGRVVSKGDIGDDAPNKKKKKPVNK